MLILYAGCLGLDLQYISAKIHSKCALQPKIAKKSLKTPLSGVQGHSRSSMLVPLESSSAVLAMIRRSLAVSRLSATVFTLDEPIVVK